MPYIIFALVAVAVAVAFFLIRHRPSNDPSRSVDSFQRAIDALDPGRSSRTKRKVRRR